jgi:DNA-directed RNA polymerase specialized sigma24 family protein
LIAARTKPASLAAQTALYDAVLPAHLATCSALLQQAHGDVWLTAEDLAQDSLTDALPQLQRGACRNLQNNGLLRWLNTVATRRLRAVTGQRKASTALAFASLLEEVDSAAVVQITVADDDPDAALFRVELQRAHAAALAELPAEHSATWVLVTEQELPRLRAAAALGVHRETVRRRVETVRAHLATRLAPFAR